MDKNEIKNEFLGYLRSTGRKGVENVITNLEELGFFEAPASTVFHLHEPGGLAQHSLNVYKEAALIAKMQERLKPGVEAAVPADSLIIAALLHDVCKAEIYKSVEKWRKDANNRWESYQSYEVDYTNMPLGHGEKSVIRLLQWGLELTDDEIVAIRWHMGAWEMPFQSAEAKGNMNAARDKSPLLSILMAADGLASSILEA